MKLGRLLGRSSAASLLALGSIALVPSAASAAPAPPTAYTAVARAYPLYSPGSGGGLSVGNLRVPYVSGMTNHLPVAEANAVLAEPDLRVTTMSGEAISGLSCVGFEEKRCQDPFLPEAYVTHLSTDPVNADKIAGFVGKEGKFPGNIRAFNACPGECGKQLVRTYAEAVGPPGGLVGYMSVGRSSATQDVFVDDQGRLVSVARSELRDVVIGSEGEVRFSSLTTTAQAFGTGAENTKDGRAEVRVSNFIILDNPVELTRAGLRLANGAPSEQEAYDGAKALLEQLKERGITLELPNVNGEIKREPNHVTVQIQAMRVRFDQSVRAPKGVAAQTVEQVFDFGASTVLVAAFDQQRRIDVSFQGNDVLVETDPAAAAPVTAPPPSAGGATPSSPGGGPSAGRPIAAPPKLPSKGHVRVNTGAPVATPPAAPAQPASPGIGGEPTEPPAASVAPDETGLPGPDEVVLGPEDVARTLRDARSVTRAFGAFLALGLVLPLARIVIRRFG